VFSEAAALEALARTPGVIPLIDYGLSPDRSAFQLVFPRYQSSLMDWRRAQGRDLSPGRVRVYLGVFLEMVEAVRKLHDAHVVHYDVKGDNFLVAPLDDAVMIGEAVGALARAGYGAASCGAAAAEQGGCSGGAGGGGRAAAAAAAAAITDIPFALVLADFGEAAVYGGGAASAGVTSDTPDCPSSSHPAAPLAYTARPRGSAAFMSPEMHMLGSGIHNREHQHYDRRRLRGAGKPHDVWSLGCSLYELLVGRAPFADDVSVSSL